MTQQEQTSSFPYAVPGAIIIAGLIIAGAVYYKDAGSQTENPAAVAQGGDTTPGSNLNLEDLRPLGADDHQRGNPDAPITIVEYSDLECPFCKNFHQTMLQLAAEYPESVTWVFRHFPLDSLHAKARPEAEAAECAYELGGHEAFWTYTDKIFEITPSNDGLDLDQLPTLAKEIGLDETAFNECVASGRTAERVESDVQNATLIGGRGTPFPVIIAPNGQTFALEGAVPLEGMKQLVEALLEDV